MISYDIFLWFTSLSMIISRSICVAANGIISFIFMLSRGLFSELSLTQYLHTINTQYQQPQVCRWYHSNRRKWRGTKESLDEGERGEWKSWLKFNIQKTKIMASSSITSRQIDGVKMEAVTDFTFLGSKITVDGDCSHEIKTHLLLRRKTMTNLDSILKSRDITLLTKVRIVKAMVFPVVMYGCESWAIKKAECCRIDAFELWCWRRLLRVPWTARRSNQSILKEINPEYSLEGLLLKLKLQYFGHLMRRTD